MRCHFPLQPLTRAKTYGFWFRFAVPSTSRVSVSDQQLSLLTNHKPPFQSVVLSTRLASTLACTLAKAWYLGAARVFCDPAGRDNFLKIYTIYSQFF